MVNEDAYEYVMVDHCYLFYGQLSPALRFIPPLDFLQDAAGWLGLRADGVVQFHTNAPLNHQRVALAAHRSQVTDLDEHPRVLGVSRKCLRARFGKRDRIVIFTGIKVGVTKGDRMLGHIPHVGHAVEAVRVIGREGFGTGTRAREAAERWRSVLRGDVDPSELPVVHRWPTHPSDVAPADAVRTEDEAAVTVTGPARTESGAAVTVTVPARISRALEGAGVQIRPGMSDAELLAVPGIGPASVREIRAAELAAAAR